MGKIENKILYELAVSRKSFWELLEKCNYPLKDFVSALKVLHGKGFVAVDEMGFYLTEKGKELVNPKSLNFKVETCPHCLGKRIIPEAKFKDIFDEFKRISAKRPRPNVDFFQGYMLEEDVVARAALMHFYGDLDGKNVVLIGDDDLLSVVLALTELPSNIVVLDVDTRIGEFLKEVNRDYGFSINFQKYNVAEPLPADFHGKFDVFSSEPLETLSGLKAFVFRGVTCLKPNGVGYFGLTFYEASLKKWLAIQKFLAKMNCVVTDIIQGFSVYPMNYETVNYESFIRNLGFTVKENTGINWYKSALFRFEVFGKAVLPMNPNKKLRVNPIDENEDLTHPTVRLSL
ncbi:MAG: bis-aminopropyl spermidine synthase family protein [Candidatus Bathyarchaeia archaeon]